MAKYGRYSPQRTAFRRNAIALTIASFFVLGSLAFYMLQNIYIIKEIEVLGINPQDEQYALAVSGIRKNRSIFFIDYETINQAFADDTRYTLVGLDRQLPDKIMLSVRYSTPYAYVSTLGLYLVMDKSGYIVGKAAYNDISDTMPIITGVHTEDQTVGRRLITREALQLETILEVLYAIENKDILFWVSELNVQDLDNIYIMLDDGMLVKLGNVEKIEEKVTLLASTVPKIRGEGYSGGVLDATNLDFADYTPTKKVQ